LHLKQFFGPCRIYGLLDGGIVTDFLVTLLLLVTPFLVEVIGWLGVVVGAMGCFS
jgi:hypothetical protein